MTESAPDNVDFSRATAARMYDYHLGGKDNGTATGAQNAYKGARNPATLRSRDDIAAFFTGLALRS